jgi:hypothetical protein
VKSKVNSKRLAARHIKMKPLKIKDIEKILKVATEVRDHTEGILSKITHFSSKTLEASKQ